MLEKLKKALFLTYNLKTWIFVFLFGLFLLIFSLLIGFLNYFNRTIGFLTRKINALFAFNVSTRAIFATIVFLLSIIIILYALYKIYKFFSYYNEGLFEKVYREAKLAKGKKIVTIGGGTGQFVLLNGLKEFTSNITAIVTTMDSGGSSQLLKTEFGVLPPGDLRNCMIALSSLPDELRFLFGKRFPKNSSLRGHTIGNLILTILAKDKGMDYAVEMFGKILQMRGKVLPVTYDKVELMAKLKDGRILEGEEKIGKEGINIEEIWLNKKAKANPEALKAIKDADLIVLGPGSLFTSIIPNLLVDGVAKAINESKAKKVYVLNVMTQYAETHGFRAENFMNWIGKYVNVDYFIMNTKKPPENVLKQYIKEKKFFVEPVPYESKKIIKAELIGKRAFARHDPKKLAKLIYSIE